MNDKRANKLLVAFLACVLASQPSIAYAYMNNVQEASNEVTKSGVSISFDQPYAAIGKPLTVYVEGADSTTCTYVWKVEEKIIGVTENSYTPKQSDIEKLLSVTVKTPDGKEISKDILVSELPVVYINIENGQEVVDKEKYLNAEMHIQGNEIWTVDEGAAFDGAIEIKGRGNTTWNEPKKPYKLKLGEKTNLFGMGKSKHWVLLANYTDQSLLRNTLAYDLSGDMGMPHMQTVWVDVVMNGKKIGNYQFCEQIRIDSERVDIFNWEDASADCAKAIAKKEGLDKDVRDAMEEAMNTDMSWITSGTFKYQGKAYNVAKYYKVPDINGGYLMELDEYFDEVSKFKTNSGQPLMFNTPEFVNTNPDMVKYVKDYVQAFEDAVANQESYTSYYDGKDQHYTDLFDMDSLVDFWLIQELFFNEDAMKKSTYLYKGIDDTFHMGPMWDMDWSASGQGDTWRYDQWQTNHFNINAQSRQWYKDLIKDPYFIMKAQERYWEVHDLLTDIVKPDGKIDTYQSYLNASAIENCNRWYNGKNTFEGSVKTLKTWMTNRINWLDQQFMSKSSILDSFKISQNTSLSVSLKDNEGNDLPQDDAGNQVASDALVPYGSDVNVMFKDNHADAMRVYVNGKVLVDEAFDREANVTIPYAEIDAQKGNSIVEVCLYQYGRKTSSRILRLGKLEAQPVSLEVTLPSKVTYELNEEFDATGMLIQARLNDDSLIDVNVEDTVIKGFDSTTPGEKTINITWKDLEASFTINVLEAHAESLVIDNIKDTYIQGESFDFSKLKVSAHMSDQSIQDVSAQVTVENFDSTQAGTNTITITYGGVSIQKDLQILKVANKEALQEAVTKGDAFILSDIYKKSDASDQSSLNVLLSIARVWLQTPTTDQALVDVATNQLLDKMQEMTDKVAVKDKKEALFILLESCKTFVKDHYSQASWNVLANARTTADDVYKNSSDISQISTAYDVLEASIHNLVNIETLRASISSAQELKEADYTAESFAVLVQAIETGQALYADGTKEAVDRAIEEIKAAVKQLVPVTESEAVEKAILNSAVQKAMIIYDTGLDNIAKAVVDRFNMSLETAVNVLANAESTPDTMMEAWLDLANAMQYLDFHADKTQLKALLVEADEINKNLNAYKEDGKQAFKDALANAKDIISSDTALDKSIHKAHDRLATAISKLIPVNDFDTTILKYFIQQADEAMADAEYYQQNAAWGIFVKAYQKAKDVYALPSSQLDIDEAAMALASAYEDIRLIPDENHLQELALLKYLINETKGAVDEADYYEKDVAWTTFLNAYDKANLLYGHANSRKAIRNAATVLADAYEDIRFIANEDRLNELHDFINRMNAMDASVFSAEDFAMITNAKEYAQSLYARNKFTAEEFSMFKEKQTVADEITKDVVVPSPEEPQDPSIPNEPVQSPSENGKPSISIPDTKSVVKKEGIAKTGDMTNTVTSMFAMMVSGASFLFLRKKRKNK